MLRANNDKAKEIIQRTRLMEDKSANTSSLASEFATRAKQQALSNQGWKDYVRNLKEAAAAYEKNPISENLAAYDTRLTEACDYFKTKYADKNQVYKPNEIEQRKTLLRAYREKIQTARRLEFRTQQAARLKESDFLDDAASIIVTPSSTKSLNLSSSPTKEASPLSINTPTASSREASAPGKKLEVTYTTISSMTVTQGGSMPQEEESFGAAFFKSFTRCCRPNTKIPIEQPAYTSMKPKRT